MTRERMYEFLIDNMVCSDEFLSGAICMGGFNTDTLEKVLYYHTGYRSFESYIAEEMSNED